MDKAESTKEPRQARQSSKKRKDKEIECEIENTDWNIGKYLTYDVLRMILRHMNIRDLSRAAMVCRSWNDAANTEIEIRISPETIGKHKPKSRIDEVLKTFTDQLSIKPNVALLFTDTRALLNCDEYILYQGRLCHYVPRETNFIRISNYDVVYNNVALKNVMSVLFLPKIPEVEIKCFTIDESELAEFRKFTGTRSREKLARKLCKISPKEENIKSIILFANEEVEDRIDASLCDDVKQIIKSITSQQENNKGDKISIWGGITHRLRVCNGDTCSHKPSIAGISICGTGVSTWSIILDKHIKTKIQAEKELTSFRDRVKLQKYSTGFMFTCCGRGKRWYSERHVEPEIFKKLFPNVPLVGSAGNGEFGVTTIPQECSKPSGCVHEFSTIFLILTYGSIKITK